MNSEGEDAEKSTWWYMCLLAGFGCDWSRSKAMGRPVSVAPLILFALMLLGTDAEDVRYLFFFSFADIVQKTDLI